MVPLLDQLVVVIVALRKLYEDASRLADAPSIVARRQQHHFAGREILLQPVVHHHAQGSLKNHRHMGQGTAVGPGIGLEVPRNLSTTLRHSPLQFTVQDLLSLDWVG